MSTEKGLHFEAIASPKMKPNQEKSHKPVKTGWIGLLFFVLWLTACTGSPTENVSPSLTPLLDIQFTPSVAVPTPTISPTASPTASPLPPTPTPSPSPTPPQVISPETVNQVIPLTRLGKGISNDVAYAPDGSRLAVASSTGVYIFDPKDFSEAGWIETDTIVWSLIFSPDGEWIATGESGGRLRLWRVSDGSEGFSFAGHEADVTHVAFSPDGNTLISASSDRIIKGWQVADGALLFTVSKTLGDVTGLVFSPDGTRFAASTSNAPIYIWDSTNGKRVYIINAHDAEVTSLAFSSDGSTLATTAKDNTVRLWDAKYGYQIATLRIQGSVSELAYSPDGQILAAIGTDLWLWDSNRHPITTIEVWGQNLTFAPDGQTLVTQGGALKVWRLSDYSLVETLEGFSWWRIDMLSITPNGSMLAAGEWAGGNISLWDIQNGKVVQVLNGGNPLWDIQISPDGKYLVSAALLMKFWQISDGTEIKSYPWKACCSAFSPDGTELAVGMKESNVRVMTFPEGDWLLNLEWETRFSNTIHTIAFSPDGRILATGDRDEKVRLWQASDGELLDILEEPSSVRSLAFSSDTLFLASALDNTIHLWQVSDGSLMVEMQGHSDRITKIAFSPDGQILASASMDGTVKFWHLDGSLLATLVGHTGGVTSLAFVQDGRTLVTSGTDGTILLWGLAP